MTMPEEGVFVLVDERSLEFSSNLPPTGIVCLRALGNYFPSEDWYDFVPVLLTWWIEAILALQFQGVGTVELLFMEGPFLARVKSLGGDRLEFSFIESQLAGERLHYSASARVGGFLRSLISASFAPTATSGVGSRQLKLSQAAGVEVVSCSGFGRRTSQPSRDGGFQPSSTPGTIIDE
jgi:hypothetical protein